MPVTIKVASEPLLANAFLIAAFWALVSTEEPNGNVAEMPPFPFSLAVAIGLATSPASAMTKLVIRIVIRIEILLILNISFG